MNLPPLCFCYEKLHSKKKEYPPTITGWACRKSPTLIGTNPIIFSVPMQMSAFSFSCPIFSALREACTKVYTRETQCMVCGGQTAEGRAPPPLHTAPWQSIPKQSLILNTVVMNHAGYFRFAWTVLLNMGRNFHKLQELISTVKQCRALWKAPCSFILHKSHKRILVLRLLVQHNRAFKRSSMRGKWITR